MMLDAPSDPDLTSEPTESLVTGGQDDRKSLQYAMRQQSLTPIEYASADVVTILPNKGRISALFIGVSAVLFVALIAFGNNDSRISDFAAVAFYALLATAWILSVIAVTHRASRTRLALASLTTSSFTWLVLAMCYLAM